jgi:hypothetical protein
MGSRQAGQQAGRRRMPAHRCLDAWYDATVNIRLLAGRNVERDLAQRASL